MRDSEMRAALFVSFIAAILIWWRNTDSKGAILGVCALLLIAALLIVSGCTINPDYRPIMQVGMASEIGPRQVVGNNPVGVVRLYQPVIPRVLGCEYMHLSSLPDQHDLATVDQIGCLITIPLGRDR